MRDYQEMRGEDATTWEWWGGERILSNSLHTRSWGCVGWRIGGGYASLRHLPLQEEVEERGWEEGKWKKVGMGARLWRRESWAEEVEVAGLGGLGEGKGWWELGKWKAEIGW